MTIRCSWVIGVLACAAGCNAVEVDTDLAVLAALRPNLECEIHDDATPLARGLFDVSGACADAYYATLLVENPVVRPVDPYAFYCGFDGARILSSRITLLQDDGSVVDAGELPNPFNVAASSVIPAGRGTPGLGILFLNVVPPEYRTSLLPLAATGSRIVALIEPTAVNVDDSAIAVKPHRFEFDLCAGCLTHCASDLNPDDRNALTEGECPDNAGADGRVCINRNC